MQSLSVTCGFVPSSRARPPGEGTKRQNGRKQRGNKNSRDNGKSGAAIVVERRPVPEHCFEGKAEIGGMGAGRGGGGELLSCRLATLACGVRWNGVVWYSEASRGVFAPLIFALLFSRLAFF